MGEERLGLVPVDYTGLSYESAQLYNPAYFSSSNTSLLEAFRNLSSHGVLRLGGNLSDVTRWKGPNGDFSTPRQAVGIEYGKTYWEWRLTDPNVRANRDGAITPEAIRNLGRFLHATDWKLIYGLNFGCGSRERAADEAMCVTQEAGDRLMAFQVGNEVDFFGGRPLFRQKPYEFEQYIREHARVCRRGARQGSAGSLCGTGCGHQHGLGRPLRPARGNLSRDAFQPLLRNGPGKGPQHGCSLSALA